MSSWWCAVHGYNVPELNAAVTEQLAKMAHVMFGGITHEPAVELGKRLATITPTGLDRVFLADSGSVSVEVAMKMAVQYQAAKGHGPTEVTQRAGRGRTKFLTLRGGYHGDTTGPMSVCDPVNGMHRLFSGFLPEHDFYDKPPAGFKAPLNNKYLADLEAFFREYATTAAAFIVEPVVQGAGGMNFYNPAYLRHFRRLCDEHGLLLIFDEIATGFGRTGRLFAAEHAGVTPDIMCVGKALTGGYLSLAATLCTEEVATTIGQGEAGVIMHGPTFMGNPLACAVAVASIDLLQSRDWMGEVGRIEARLRRRLFTRGPAPTIKDIRVLGAIGVIESHRPVDVAKLQAYCVDRGVWVRPFGRLIYTMPPFTISDAELNQLCRTVLDAAGMPEHFLPN